LDYRRLRELRIATEAACEPIHVLAAALAVVLEEARGNRLDEWLTYLDLMLQALNRARTNPHTTHQTYGAAIDNAQAAADAFQTIPATDPAKTAQALSDAHDALVGAVRNNNGEFAGLITSLNTLAQDVSDLEKAVATAKESSAKENKIVSQPPTIAGIIGSRDTALAALGVSVTAVGNEIAQTTQSRPYLDRLTNRYQDLMNERAAIRAAATDAVLALPDVIAAAAELNNLATDMNTTAHALPGRAMC
jgi:hypothetical protein